MTPSTMIAAERRWGRRYVVSIVAVVAVAMLGAVLTLAASTPRARAQLDPFSVTPATCYAVDEGNGGDDNHLVQVDVAGDGSFTFTDLGVINNGATAPVAARNIESIAYRNGAEPRAIYTQDPATDSLIRINRNDGTDTEQVAIVDIGDIDGLTWRNDNDTDPTNDELWGIERLAGSPNLQDRIVRIDPINGGLIGTPVVVQTTGNGAENDVDGLAWDPATDTFYAPVNGSTSDNELITIDPATGAVTVVGQMGIEDVEGIGFTDAGEMFGMTGADGAEPNLFLYIDKTTGLATRLGPITIYADYESFDCAGVAPVLQPDLQIRLDVVALGDPCPVDFASATEGVGTPLAVQVGDDVTYCFKVINNGPGDAQNVTIDHPALAAPVNLGDVGAGGEAMSMVDDVVEAGDGETTATVTGENTLGDPVPQAEDPAAVDPVQPPVLDIRLDVVALGDSCPADFASATEGDGPALSVFVGEAVTYCFKVVNTGPDTATNVVVNHPALAAPLDLPDIAAGGEGMGMVDDIVELGDAQTTATVDGDDRLGNPVPQAADTAVVDPSEPVATIGDFVWRDNDRDGIQDAGEPGIEGVTVVVYSANPDGSINAVIDTVLTGAAGEWSLEVAPGDYRVFFALPTGADGFSPRDVGGDDTVDSDVITTSPDNGFTDVYTVANGDDDQTIDAGVVYPIAPAEIGDFVWQDLDGDGLQDPGEPGIEGIIVDVTDTATGNFVTSDTTDANGEWLVTVDPGTYTVTFLNSTIGDFTTNDAGSDDSADSDADPGTGIAPAVTVGEGESNRTIDAGIVFPSPAIGLAKDLAAGPTRIGQTDEYDVSYSFVIENLGDVDLVDVLLSDNVAAGLAATSGSVVSGPTPNIAGDCSTAVALGTQTLAVGESCTAVWDFVIANPGGAELAFDNSATVQGTPPSGPPVTDTSDDGTDPDPDGDGDADEPGENDPTPAVIPALASLGDKVWDDANANGLDDDGANGIVAVTVELLDATGTNVLATDTTDADGLYGFTGLDAGTYVVRFVAPADRDFTTQDTGADDTIDSDADPATGETDPVTLAAGDNDPTIDAGLIALPASLGDYVWEDTDGDGIQDAGEPPVEGVVVNLYDGTGGDLGLSDTTDADGLYGFEGLDAGEYIVEFIAPAGREFTAQDAGGDDTIDSDVDPIIGRTGVVTLAPGEDDPTNDAGLLPVGSISDLVFDDLDGDGIQDVGEPGVEGVTVELLDGSAGLLDSTSTDANGNYIFGGLAAGGYIVEFTPPVGRELTLQDQGGDDAADSDADPATGRTGVIALGLGEDNDTVDAGVAPLLASLGDYVWEDLNGDGIQDGGEPPVEGVLVTLLDGAGGATGQSTTTDAGGFYGFADLLAGEYVVEFTAPAGRGFTVQDQGGDDAADSDVDPVNGRTGVITLAPGEDDPTNDAGIAPLLGSISDLVFDDLDGDGIQDVGEPGVEGVTVELLDGSAGLLDSTSTDANGNYVFADLLEGDYIVRFVPPADTTFTAQDQGVDDSVDSDPDPATGETAVISLAAGEDNTDIDAGIAPLVPAIGLAKALSAGPTRQGTGEIYDFTYTFVIENLGETPLTGVTLSDNVAAGLVATTGSVVSGPTPNPAGDCSTAVALGTQTLAVGESCTAVWDFEIANPGGAELAFDNSATVDGTPPSGPPVTDISDDGTDPDPDGDGDADEPGENDPTPALIPALASLGDKVFEDTNENGIQDAGEPGVGGVSVVLLDGSGADTGRFATTDVNGDYSFERLDAGTYVVEFTAPTDRDFTSQDVGADDTVDSDVDPATGRTGQIVLAAGEDDPTNDAGLTPLPDPVGSISDLVFDDLDGDGIQDPGEPGLAGVTVTLLDGDANTIPGIDPVVTDVDGNYIFDELAAGDYIVEFTAPTGSGFSPRDVGGDDTVDSDAGADGRTATIALGAGEDNDTVDAGITPLVPAIGLAKALTDGPTLDDDGNWVMEFGFVIENLGELPLSDVGITDDFPTVFAPGTLEAGPTPISGTCDATDAFLGTASLAVGESCTAVWSIVVSGLTPGETYLNTAVATGTPPSGPPVTDTSDDGTEPDGDGDGDADEPGENDPTPITIPATEVAVLGDKVFLDADGDGIQDAGEEPVEGVVVQIRRPDGSELTTVTTDTDGLWSATVEPGDWVVAVVLPEGYEFSPQDQGDDDQLDSDIDPESGLSATVTVVAADIDNSIDTGLVPLGSLGNRVFLDENNDGIEDPDEPPVEGATVQLYEANPDGTKGALVETQVTGPDGSYLFANLSAGGYIVVVIPPGGFIVGPQDAGADDEVDNDISPLTGDSDVIFIGIGENLTTVDAGVVPAPVTPPVNPPFVPPSSPTLPSPTITNAPGPAPVSAPEAPSSPPLATTGSNSNVLATLAIAMTAIGGTLLIAARRQRDYE